MKNGQVQESTEEDQFCMSIHGMFLIVSAATVLAADKFPDPNTPEWRELFAVDVSPTALDHMPLADPAPSTQYKVRFRGEIAGLNVGYVYLTVDTSPDGYAVNYAMEQRGIARWFSDAEAKTRARGTFNESGEVAAHYYFNHDYERDDDQQYVELYRGPDSRRIHLWTAPTYTFHGSVPEDVALGAVDPMAALVSLSLTDVPAGESPCNRRVKVFDGRRRFDLVMREDGRETFRSRNDDRFSGTAYKCKLEQIKVAGYREKDKGDIEGDLWVYLTEAPPPYRSSTFAYVPILLEARRGIFTARLEARDPIITGPGGRKTDLGDLR
jgi:hypothetical protein